MVDPCKFRYLNPSKLYRRFSLLFSIKKNPRITQKKLGEETNLSSSMVNNYIKELSRDELLNVEGESNRTMTYHLTLKGGEYVSNNFLAFSAEIVQFYAGVRSEIIEILDECYGEGVRTVVLYGASDTAEVVYSAIQRTDLIVSGIVDNDPDKVGTLFWGSLIQSPVRINEMRPDALLVTSFARQNEILESLAGKVDENIKVKVITRV